jgi:hypothetical protein
MHASAHAAAETPRHCGTLTPPTCPTNPCQAHAPLHARQRQRQQQRPSDACSPLSLFPAFCVCASRTSAHGAAPATKTQQHPLSRARGHRAPPGRLCGRRCCGVLLQQHVWAQHFCTHHAAHGCITHTRTHTHTHTHARTHARTSNSHLTGSAGKSEGACMEAHCCDGARLWVWRGMRGPHDLAGAAAAGSPALHIAVQGLAQPTQVPPAAAQPCWMRTRHTTVSHTKRGKNHTFQRTTINPRTEFCARGTAPRTTCVPRAQRTACSVPPTSCNARV